MMAAMAFLQNIQVILCAFVWRTLPRLSAHLSRTLGAISLDGRYLSGVPVVNILLPFIMFGLGVYTGVADRMHMPVYTVHTGLLAVMMIGGIASGYLGIIAMAGFMLGDTLFFMNTFEYYFPQQAYPLAVLGSWIFLWQLIVGFPVLTQRITQISGKWQRWSGPLSVIVIMALTQIWTQLAMIVLRPMFLWNGKDPAMKLVNFGEVEWELLGLHLHLFSWLAGVAMVVRLIVAPFIAARMTPVAAPEMPERGFLNMITLPWPCPAMGRAAVFTLLLAGLFTKIWTAALFWLVMAGLFATRSLVSGHHMIARWDEWIAKVPVLARLFVTYAAAFALSYLLIGLFRDVLLWRTMQTAAIVILFCIAATLPLWPQTQARTSSLPLWLKQRLPWLKASVPGVLFGFVTVAAGAAYAHHCSFQPGCECLTGNGALAGVTAGFAAFATMVMGALGLSPDDFDLSRFKPEGVGQNPEQNVLSKLGELNRTYNPAFMAWDGIDDAVIYVNPDWLDEVQYGKQFLYSLTPLAGWQEVATGRDSMTGEELATWQRIAMIAPISKLAEKLKRTELRNIDDVLEQMRNKANLESIWNKRPFERGKLIEDHLAQTDYRDWYRVGSAKDGKFPLVDFQRGNHLVSLKTVDTNSSGWLKNLEAHIQDLSKRGATVDDRTANIILDLRVSPGGLEKAEQIIEVAQRQGIQVILKEF